MIEFIKIFYLLGVFATTMYIAIQLFLELPQDLKDLKKYKSNGDLPEDSSEFLFVLETILSAVVLALIFPLFWYLEYKRGKM